MSCRAFWCVEIRTSYIHGKSANCPPQDQALPITVLANARCTRFAQGTKEGTLGNTESIPDERVTEFIPRVWLGIRRRNALGAALKVNMMKSSQDFFFEGWFSLRLLLRIPL